MALNYPCPICRSTDTPVHFEASEHRFYKCQKCRTAFVWPQPTAEDLFRFYDRYHKSDDSGGVYDKVESRMQVDFAGRISRIRAASGGKDIRLLDVGCGKGYFVKACVDAGIKAEGCDLSASGIAFATEKLGVKATVGDLSVLKSSLEKFDVITFFEVHNYLTAG